jgi:hypothetical protein
MLLLRFRQFESGEEITDLVEAVMTMRLSDAVVAVMLMQMVMVSSCVARAVHMFVPMYDRRPPRLSAGSPVCTCGGLIVVATCRRIQRFRRSARACLLDAADADAHNCAVMPRIVIKSSRWSRRQHSLRILWRNSPVGQKHQNAPMSMSPAAAHIAFKIQLSHGDSPI